MWLVGYVTLRMDCQTPVTPLMRGYTLCDLSVPQSVPWTRPKKLKRTPESGCEVWLDSHILEVCTATRGSERTGIQKTLFSSAATDFKRGRRERTPPPPPV